MELSRRTLLGGFTAVLGGSLVGCSSGMDTGTTAKKNTTTELAMWCWPGGLGKSVLDDTIAHFPDPKIKYSEIGGDFKQKLITTFNGGTGIRVAILQSDIDVAPGDTVVIQWNQAIPTPGGMALLGLAGLVLEASPRPGVPAKRGIPRQIAGRLFLRGRVSARVVQSSVHDVPSPNVAAVTEKCLTNGRGARKLPSHGPS